MTPGRQLQSFDDVYRVLGLPRRPGWRAVPEPPSRVNFDELSAAEAAQLIETAAARGVPPHGVSWVSVVDDPGIPTLLAEFAGHLVFRREGRQLIQRRAGEPVRRSERSDLHWLFAGELERTPDGSLAVGRFQLLPRPDVGEPDQARFRGVTVEVLRAIKVSEIVKQTVSRLRESEQGIARLEELTGWALSPHLAEQRNRLAEVTNLAATAPRRGGRRKHPDGDIEAVARRYLELQSIGHSRGILTVLAAELGVSREAARDRVHVARVRQYITKGTPGRAGARPGPRLTGETSL